MIVAVVGGGAVGTFLGATLATVGHEVVLVGRDGTPGTQRLAISVRGPGDESTTADLLVAGTPEGLPSPPEVVVVAVRMPDLPGAIETAATWPDVPVLAVENGIGADELLRDARSGVIIAGSLTASIVFDRTSGTVRRLSRGGIGLAPVHAIDAGSAGAIDRASAAPPLGGIGERLATSFETGGLRVRRLRDAAAMRWSKLLANLLGNATSAILDMDPAEVYRDPALFEVERRQLREALAVMRALGLSPVALPGADVRPLALAARLPSALVRPVMVPIIGGGRGGKSPSLRLHLEAGGGPSEVAWLNGAVASAALGLGRRAPVNARLAELVEACSLDRGRWDWFRGQPGRLIAELPGR